MALEILVSWTSRSGKDGYDVVWDSCRGAKRSHQIWYGCSAGDGCYDDGICRICTSIDRYCARMCTAPSSKQIVPRLSKGTAVTNQAYTISMHWIQRCTGLVGIWLDFPLIGGFGKIAVICSRSLLFVHFFLIDSCGSMLWWLTCFSLQGNDASKVGKGWETVVSFPG